MIEEIICKCKIVYVCDKIIIYVDNKEWGICCKCKIK